MRILNIAVRDFDVKKYVRFSRVFVVTSGTNIGPHYKQELVYIYP